MKIYKLLFTLVFFSCFCSFLIAQKELKGVVKIENFDAQGNLIETGSGIICGSTKNEIFIVTAFHVIDEGDNILVSFHNRQWEQFKAKVHNKFNPDLDYAVLVVNVEVKKINPVSYHQPDFDKIQNGDRIHCVGHPDGEDWTHNKQNVINNPQFTSYNISFSNIGIGPGFSGGALYTKKKSRLIGLIVNVDTQNTIAVRIDQIIRDLGSWEIPHNYLLPYKPPRRKSFYVSSALALGSAATGYFFHNAAESDYSIYESNRDPNAKGIYDDITRDNLYARVNQNKDYRNIAAAATGGFVILAAVLSGRKYKKKKSKKKKK